MKLLNDTKVLELLVILNNYKIYLYIYNVILLFLFGGVLSSYPGT